MDFLPGKPYFRNGRKVIVLLENIDRLPVATWLLNVAGFLSGIVLFGEPHLGSGLEFLLRNVGDTDGGNSLTSGHAGLFGCTLASDNFGLAGGTNVLVCALLRFDLFQQLPGAPDGAASYSSVRQHLAAASITGIPVID